MKYNNSKENMKKTLLINQSGALGDIFFSMDYLTGAFQLRCKGKVYVSAQTDW